MEKTFYKSLLNVSLEYKYINGIMIEMFQANLLVYDINYFRENLK